MENGACRSGMDRVLYFFEEISRFPRRSYVTEPIAEYLCHFARERGLFFLRDAADNVIIKKAASKGFEAKDAVILQAHTDMVFVQADPRAVHDESAGICLQRNGDALSAAGTSLGADDGIGMAYILAILDDKTLLHPAIEAVFTSNEEVGLLGATALDASALSGKMLINLDSDEEGNFTVGCAGGSTATLTIPFEKRTERKCRALTLSGLPGGHSGADIHRGIANAILLLFSMLEALGEKVSLELAEISGGEASNAIPAFASARFYCEMKNEEIEVICKAVCAACGENLGDAAITLAEDDARPCLEVEKSRALIRHILDLPRGILAMEQNLAGLPETSLNLGKIETSESEIVLSYSLRSSVDQKCRALENALRDTIEKIGGKAEIDGVYPAWEFKKESRLREACLAVFRRRYKKEAMVSVIHAGLECGILAKKIPGLDCISFGPDNRCIHTVDETLSLSSAEAVYDCLTEVLASL